MDRLETGEDTLAHLGVGVPHHGNQEVQQEDDKQGDEEEEVYFRWTKHEERIVVLQSTYECVLDTGEGIPDISKLPQRHDEHLTRK